MHIQKKIINIRRLLFLCIITTILLIAASCMKISAASEADKDASVLKVVITNCDDAGYVKMEDKELTGYYIDYLNEISKYTGWRYDYHVISDADQLELIVRQGDYDLLLGICYTQQDDVAYFDYPTENLGNRRYVLATTKNHPDLDENHLSSLMGIQVGYVDNQYSRQIKEKFESYCVSNGLEYTVNSKEQSDRGVNMMMVKKEDRYQMLKNGELDTVIITDSQALDNQLYVVCNFARVPFYAVVPNGDDRYLAKLDETIRTIKNLDSNYDSRLYEQYFAANNQNQLSFTEQEQEFLQEKHHYKVALWDNCAPYGYRSQDGSWGGVAVEVFKRISEMTNDSLTFEFVSYADSFQANAAFEKGEVDIIGQTFTSVEIAKRGNNRSRTYYTDRFQMYLNASSVKSMEEARVVIKRDVSDEMLKKMGVANTEHVIRVDTVVDALQMVNEGRADITFALQNVGDYYINYYQMSKLRELDVQMDAASLCCVYGRNMDDIAKVICNRCIGYIDETELSRNITEYILSDHKPVSLRDFVKSNLSIFSAVVIIALILLTTFLIIVVFTIQNKSKRIYRMLYHDDITEGISYLKFEEEVKELARDSKERYYILFADIYNFKYINDVFGYECGNKVLCTVEDFVQSLSGGLPFARMYADHFVGIRRYSDKKQLQNLLNERIGSFTQQCRREYPEFNVFLKIGIYEWNGENISEIRQYVNLANYAADGIKNLSSSEYCFYTMEMHDKILSRQEIEKDMHRAMKEGEFVAFYQPKYDIETNQIIGAEALVRWQHKTKGLISPGMFIPIFEENGYIIEIDFCMLKHVCTFLSERLKKGENVYPVSCNFSRRHFQHPEFVQKITEMVNRYKVPASLIEIEITETVATDDFHTLIQTVVELKEKGFKISIDDFGSGYSCIQLLYKLPIDVLKLDRVFVLGQNVNEKEEAINKSIIHICHDNDIKIVCEGVETQEQCAFVQSYGCRFVQGFLYSKPVCEVEFAQMLNKLA